MRDWKRWIKDALDPRWQPPVSPDYTGPMPTLCDCGHETFSYLTDRNGYTCCTECGACS